jgi:Tfp pilus assembly protein PilV
MRRSPERRTLPSQAGFALIEVVVSALILVTVTGGVIRVVSATGKSGAEERHRSQAFSIAQEDQARLRSTRIADLATAIAPRTVTLNGTPYEVTSTATSVSDKTGTTTCGTGARADYVRLSSEVSWPSMRETAAPIKIESIVSPVTGSLDPTSGNLSVTVNNASVPAVPISGVGLSGSGPGSFSGSTDSNGCALFGGQPAGNYTLTPTLSSEYVDFNGKKPSAITVSVTGGTTTPVVLEYDKEGSVKVGFTARGSDGVIRTSAADAITATATGMTPGTRTFGTPGGTPTSMIEAKPLYPFNYTYNFFAGSCAANKPEGGLGAANERAPSGGPAASTTIQLPTLYLTVKNSSGSTAEKAGLKNAKVTVTDTKCSVGSTAVKRSYLTTEAGALPDPGLAWSTYDICASAPVGPSSAQRRIKSPGVIVHSLTGTALTLTLKSGTGSGVEAGEC